MASKKNTLNIKVASNNTLSLGNAKRAKADEFYTQLDDISKELRYYKAQLRGKTIFCNCDDPFESNFFNYFALNFNTFRIKKLITTSYKKSPIVGRQLPLLDIAGLRPDGKEPYAIEINAVPDHKGTGATNITDVEFLLRHNANVAKPLRGDGEFNDGDFRSLECVSLLKEADIVITNPPFSLFREFVGQLVNHGKQFLIIGNVNAVTYRDVFDLIMNNKVWFGPSIHSGDREFRVPDHYPLNASGVRVDSAGNKFIKVKGVRWFTNMDNSNRHEEIPLYRHYSPNEFPTYHNYNAIEVGKVSDIPSDYMGEMGVPITFLDKYNPKQFDIIGSSRTLAKPMSTIAPKASFMQGGPRFYLATSGGTYRRLYDRIVIRRKV